MRASNKDTKQNDSKKRHLQKERAEPESNR
jgi:hypothetical protein